MLISIDVKYQDRKDGFDESGKYPRLVNDGASTSARICERMLVADKESAARMGNDLAAGFRKYFNEQYPNDYRKTAVSIVIRNHKTGDIIVECWEGATQYAS